MLNRRLGSSDCPSQAALIQCSEDYIMNMYRYISKLLQQGFRLLGFSLLVSEREWCQFCPIVSFCNFPPPPPPKKKTCLPPSQLTINFWTRFGWEELDIGWERTWSGWVNVGVNLLWGKTNSYRARYKLVTASQVVDVHSMESTIGFQALTDRMWHVKFHINNMDIYHGNDEM